LSAAPACPPSIISWYNTSFPIPNALHLCTKRLACDGVHAVVRGGRREERRGEMLADVGVRLARASLANRVLDALLEVVVGRVLEEKLALRRCRSGPRTRRSTTART
jgi:hypothetical protein